MRFLLSLCLVGSLHLHLRWIVLATGSHCSLCQIGLKWAAVWTNACSESWNFALNGLSFNPLFYGLPLLSHFDWTEWQLCACVPSLCSCGLTSLTLRFCRKPWSFLHLRSGLCLPDLPDLLQTLSFVSSQALTSATAMVWPFLHPEESALKTSLIWYFLVSLSQYFASSYNFVSVSHLFRYLSFKQYFSSWSPDLLIWAACLQAVRWTYQCYCLVQSTSGPVSTLHK